MNTRGARGAAARLVCALIVPVLTGAALTAQQPANAQVEAARATLDKWVETRSLISKEKRDWKLGKEVLEDRIDVVKHEIESLRGKITDAEKSIGEAEKKQHELQTENERLEEASSALQKVVGTFESRTRTLVNRLPDPIRDRVKPFSQQLPDDIANSKLSLGQRFQNVVGILNEIDKFQRQITMVSEVRQIGDGSTAEVTTIYVGLGAAYYVNNKGTAAGIGTPASDGWVWRAANDAAPRIARAIAILKNEKVAEFVPLPVQIL